MIKINKRGQEEIIGFGIILIVIAVVALIFLSISLNKSDDNGTSDFEVSSFLNSLMEKTTICEKNSNLLSVKDLIFECGRGNICQNKLNACESLNNAIEAAMQDNWKIGEETITKGYSILIYYEEELLVEISEGEETLEYRGANQDYAKGIENVEIYLEIY